MIPLLKSKNLLPQPPSQEQPSRAPAKKNSLPLKELYLDDTHYNSENLEIYWLPPDKIAIKSDKRSIFGPIDMRAHAQSLTVSYFYLLPFANTFTDVTSTSIMSQIPLPITQYFS
jgi:hypothetical protein